MTVIDADSHVEETRSVWADRTEASRRDLALPQFPKMLDGGCGFHAAFKRPPTHRYGS